MLSQSVKKDGIAAEDAAIQAKEVLHVLVLLFSVVPEQTDCMMGTLLGPTVSVWL